MNIDELLAAARSRLTRVTAEQASQAMADGALLVISARTRSWNATAPSQAPS